MRAGMTVGWLALLLMVASGNARADTEVDAPPRTSRVVFWTAAATAVAALGLATYGAGRVHEYEDARVDAWDELLAQQPELGRDRGSCAAAANLTSPAAEQVSSACDGGRRWAAITNVSLVTGGVAILTAGYFLYRGYLADRPRRTMVTPIVSSEQVGVGLACRF